MAGIITIGTAGFSFPHWQGPFYPRNLQQGGWIEYYARHFRGAGVNTTFYAEPRAGAAVHAYFKNDPKAAAVRDAMRLQQLTGAFVPDDARMQPGLFAPAEEAVEAEARNS